MFQIWRIAVMWLLALAVPAQGFAAASMLNCVPGHHGTASGQVQADHHRHDAHGHGGAADADAGENVASSDADTASAHGIHKGKTGSCSVCAACCTAAVPSSAAPAFEALPAPDVFQPLAPPGAIAFLTDGPQRPPRSFLA